MHAPADALLRVTGITKHYGGIRAVDNVTFTVEAGETVGVIGPNGAGKTTLFELLGGFVRPQTGRVVFAGRDVSRLSPETRGRLGLIRSFQDASLFPTMTVEDVVAVALERAVPTRFVPAVLGLPGAERRREARARQLIDLMGLTPFRYRQIAELSTGTRRITELACLVALEPTLLLLDEPSSGIAQAETDALGELLQRMKAHLGVTLVIIEHDMPLLMSLADRLIAMDAGKVLADGPAEDVRADPAVVESYLGADMAAIARPGDVTAPTRRSTERCRGVTRAGERCSRPGGPDGLCAQHRNLIGVGP